MMPYPEIVGADRVARPFRILAVALSITALLAVMRIGLFAISPDVLSDSKNVLSNIKILSWSILFLSLHIIT